MAPAPGWSSRSDRSFPRCAGEAPALREERDLLKRAFAALADPDAARGGRPGCTDACAARPRWPAR